MAARGAPLLVRGVLRNRLGHRLFPMVRRRVVARRAAASAARRRAERGADTSSDHGASTLLYYIK
jgi:hypothetical protein